MEDRMKMLAAFAGVGAALGAGVALGMGLRVLLWGAAFGIALTQPQPSLDVYFWVGVLLVQSLPYLAALLMALLSARPQVEASSDEVPV